MDVFLRVRPGTTAATEKEILDRFRAIAPTWSFDIDWLEENREQQIHQQLAPIVIGGLVAGFLLLMVGLGLTGVLWQNVTLRTREIGLRRAVGATGSAVRWQVLLELQVLSALAIGLGALVAGQLPLLELDMLPRFEPLVLVQSLVVSGLLLFLLTTACGLYPSWLATRIHPAEALHYE
jgi:putative ABC transport system permease protein